MRLRLIKNDLCFGKTLWILVCTKEPTCVITLLKQHMHTFSSFCKQKIWQQKQTSLVPVWHRVGDGPILRTPQWKTKHLQWLIMHQSCHLSDPILYYSVEIWLLTAVLEILWIGRQPSNVTRICVAHIFTLDHKLVNLLSNVSPMGASFSTLYQHLFLTPLFSALSSPSHCLPPFTKAKYEKYARLQTLI